MSGKTKVQRIDKRTRDIFALLGIYTISIIFSVVGSRNLKEDQKDKKIYEETEEGTIVSYFYEDPDDNMSKESINLLKVFTIIKIVLNMSRSLLSRGRFNIGTVDSLSMGINAFVILLLFGMVYTSTMESFISNIISLFGYEININLSEFVERMQVVDIWLMILGGMNTVVPISSLFNSTIGYLVLFSGMSGFISESNTGSLFTPSMEN